MSGKQKKKIGLGGLEKGWETDCAGETSSGDALPSKVLEWMCLEINQCDCGYKFEYQPQQW